VPGAALDERSLASSGRWADAERCTGYAVYDPVGKKIGSVEEAFVNREGDPVYLRVNIGILISRTVLIPVQFVETGEERKPLVLK
jgi:PRC-barrel domain